MSETSSINTFIYNDSLITLVESDHPHIRLIEVQPSENFQDEINIKLREYPLGDDCPEYETLSYVWGDPNDRMVVWCNDLALEVTTSLGSALRYLRTSTHRLIWIDQISINQSNDIEKTFQVGLMRDIYQNSARTLGWLGPDNESTTTTFTVFKQFAISFGEILLSEDGNNLWYSLSGNTWKHAVTISRESEKYLGSRAPTADEVKKFNETFSNPWFARMWVVQEIAVSRELTLIGGWSEIDYDSFALGLAVYQGMSAETRRNNRINAGQDNIADLIKIRGAHRKRNDPVRDRQLVLPYLLAKCCRFKASDLRDRFYALYGLSSSWVTSAALSPDYTSPPTEAMCATVFKILQYDKSLRLLELAECKNDPSLPSWIPGPRSPADPELLPLSRLLDSDTEGVTNFIEAYANVQRKALDEKFSGFDWDAFDEAAFAEQRALSQRAEKLGDAPTTPLEHLGIEGSTTLCLKGQLLDRIEELSPVVLQPGGINRGYGCVEHDMVNLSAKLDEADTFSGAFGVTMKFAGAALNDWRMYNDANVKMDAMVMNRKSSVYPSRKELLAAYRNTVCAGRWNLASDGERYPSVCSSLVGDLSDEEGATAFEAWRSTIAGGVRINSLKSKMGLKDRAGWTGLLSTSVSAHSSYSMPYKIMTGTAMESLLGRRLAWTVKGHLALVPAKSEPNDLIFCLRGGDMPFVLRPSSNAFQLLGPTYLDGYMNGELANIEAHGMVKLV